MRRSIYSIVMILITLPCLAQDQVTGWVTDGLSGEPLAGALVFSDLDTVISGSSGWFQVSYHHPAISLQMLGYERQTVPVLSDSVQARMEPSVLSLNEITVSATLKQNKIKNTAASVNLVSKSMIQRDDPYSIRASLNRVPGVYVHSGTYSTNRITIRGVGTRSPYGTTKIKAYYDQIPLTDGSGNSTIEDIDQLLIHRMEILKGPNSSIYGAGLAGVVRLYSPAPEADVTSVESGINTASYGSYRLFGKFSHDQAGKGFSVSYTKTKSDGYRENSSYDRDQVGLLSRWQLGRSGSLKLIGTYTDLKSYIPSSINEQDYLNNPETAAFTWRQAKGYEAYKKILTGLSFTSELKGGIELASAVFFKYRDAFEPRPFDILVEETAAIGTRNIFTIERKKLGISGGFELFYDIYNVGTFENTAPQDGSEQGPRESGNREYRNYYNVFTEASYLLTSRLSIVGGVNFNSTSYRLDDRFAGDGQDLGGDYRFEPAVSPRVGVVYHLNASSHLFANVSHGFSPPSVEETLTPEGQINPDIQPENGWNYELGLRGNLKNLSYDLVGYYMRINDLLVAERTGDDQYVGVNAGLNAHLGLDLLLNYTIDLAQNYRLNVFNSLSVMDYRFTEFVHRDISFGGKMLPGVPGLTVNPGLEVISKNGFYGNVNGQYVGDIPIDDANSVYTAAYFVVRMKAGYALTLGPLQLDINGGINNLLDEKYASMLLINATGFNGASPRYYYPGTPRNYYAGIHLRYVIKKP